MRALAFREVLQELCPGEQHFQYIADKIDVEVDGKVQHPSRQAIRKFFERVDSDDDWFPGKHSGTKRGPAPLLNGAKRRCMISRPSGIQMTLG